MEDISLNAEVDQLLLLFDSLPASAQATALHKLQERKRLTHPNYEAAEAHSCGLCKIFGLSWTSPDRDQALAAARSRLPDFDESGPGARFQYPYFSKRHSLTKEALLQGLSRQCLLFQWIFALLARSVASLKVEVDHQGVLVRPNLRNASGTLLDDRLDHPKYDLDYIDTARGLEVRIQFNHSGTEGGTLTIRHDPEPNLLDNLWAASPKAQQDSKYQTFEQMYRGISRTRLIGYTTSDDPVAKLVLSRPSRSSLDAEDGFRLARGWLDECTQKHPNCAKEGGVLPSRVIDVGIRFPVRTVKLHWTEEGEIGQYLALSYCWGGKQTLVTTTATAQEFTDGIPAYKIPRTLLDAINLTQKLGLRFIWVDALCIIQDDAEDVAREISKMAQIYREACVTISAACAESVHDGFISRQRIPTGPSLKLPFAGKDAEGSIYLQQPHIYSSTEDPIHLRAWTLQEHILPQRTLLYGTQGLWWTCSSKEYSDISSTLDDTNVPRPPIVPGAAAATHPTISSWRSIVRGYTRRYLTFPADKLPAIAGVAAHYSKTFSGAYLAGLWRFTLDSDLMWCSTRADITRPMVQRAPSWSWAAVDGEIHHDWCPLTFGLRRLHIQSCTATPTSMSSPFGSVDPQQCILSLRGWIAEVFWHEDRKRILKSRPESTDDVALLEIGRSQADALELSTVGLGIFVWALIVQDEPCRGLLLERVGNDRYRRMGLFYRIWETSECRFQRKDITII